MKKKKTAQEGSYPEVIWLRINGTRIQSQVGEPSPTLLSLEALATCHMPPTHRATVTQCPPLSATKSTAPRQTDTGRKVSPASGKWLSRVRWAGKGEPRRSQRQRTHLKSFFFF